MGWVTTVVAVVGLELWDYISKWDFVAICVQMFAFQTLSRSQAPRLHRDTWRVYKVHYHSSDFRAQQTYSVLVCGSVQSCQHESVAQGLLGRLLLSAAGSTVDRTMICLRKVKKHPMWTTVVSSSYIVIVTKFPSDLLHKYLPHNCATVYFQCILYMQASSSLLSLVRFARILVSHTWETTWGWLHSQLRSG